MLIFIKELFYQELSGKFYGLNTCKRLLENFMYLYL